MVVETTKTSWWFQPLWKICSSNWIVSPRGRGEHKKYLSCHHNKNFWCQHVWSLHCPHRGRGLHPITSIISIQEKKTLPSDVFSFFFATKVSTVSPTFIVSWNVLPRVCLICKITVFWMHSLSFVAKLRQKKKHAKLINNRNHHRKGILAICPSCKLRQRKIKQLRYSYNWLLHSCLRFSFQSTTSQQTPW